jgi:hypothetical protein
VSKEREGLAEIEEFFLSFIFAGLSSFKDVFVNDIDKYFSREVK